jgi:AraC-like DNA-binding protein
MAIAGRGHIVVWEGASLWMLEAAQERPETRPHSHHAIQITFQLKGSFELSTQGKRVSAPVVAVASDTSHAFQASGAAAFLFIEPESPAGRALAQDLFAQCPIVELDSEQATAWLERLRGCFRNGGGEAEMLMLGREIVGGLPEARGSLLPDPRVRKMIAYATANMQERMTLPSAAAHINLSQSRARHLFVSHTGLPFKTYVLWRRLEKALQLYAAGASLTEATHLAGFADSAHFSRTFKRTFGVPASALNLGRHRR